MESYDKLIAELVDKVREKRYRALNLIKPYTNKKINMYAGQFDDNEHVHILEQCFAKKIQGISKKHPENPYLVSTPIDYFSISSDFARQYPEITRNDVIKLAEHKFNEEFASAVTKLDNIQWEMEITAGIIAEKVEDLNA